MKKLDYIKGLAQEMIAADDKRNKYFVAMENMAHNRWELPSELKDADWIRAIKSTDPHDALNTAVRTLSTVRPKLKIQPLAEGEENRRTADKIERAILWELNLAGKRAQTPIVRDITRSALLYDMVACQVVYLPYQYEALKDIRSATPRMQALLRQGKYAVVSHNPRHVHARFSFLGLETVLLAKKMLAKDIIAFWGDRAKAIKNYLGDKQDIWLSYFDLSNYDQRAVWVSTEDVDESTPIVKPTSKKGFTILDEENELPFLNWVVRRGGTNLEEEEEFKYKPLLDAVARAGLWNNQNIANSLVFSEALAYAAAPRLKVSAPNPDVVDVDYGEINRRIDLRPGEDVEQLAPPILDRNLAELVDRLQGQISKTTVAKFLQNLEVPAGTAFATVNALVQAATSSIDPYKKVAEQSIADIATTMLYWIDYTDDKLMVYSGDERTPEYGAQDVVGKNDFDVNHLYVACKLTAHVPTDYQQRVNTMVAMSERLGYPKGRALEDIDVTDPDAALDEKYEEMRKEADFQMEMMQRQLDMRALAQQAQQAQQQAQQQQYPQGGIGAETPAMFEATQGQGGFNPAAGGQSPLQVAPMFTREAVTGRTRGGEEIVE